MAPVGPSHRLTAFASQLTAYSHVAQRHRALLILAARG